MHVEQRPETWTTADLASITGNGTPGDQRPVVAGTVTRANRSPVAHAPLTLTTLRGEQVDRAMSDQTGCYQLHPPVAGSYIVICVAGEHQPRASLVTVSDRPVRHDIELAGTGSVSGTVRLGGSVGDASGVVVTVTDASGTVVAAATTDALGGYAFGDLAEGTYTVTAASMEHEPVALAVMVPAGGHTERDIDLAGRCRLTGTVRASSDGRPVHEALVTVIDGAGSVVGAAPTTKAGTFAFDNLPEGPYTLTAAGYAPVATQVHLAAGTANSTDITLTSPSG